MQLQTKTRTIRSLMVAGALIGSAVFGLSREKTDLLRFLKAPKKGSQSSAAKPVSSQTQTTSKP